jgi:hypothetical protein
LVILSKREQRVFGVIESFGLEWEEQVGVMGRSGVIVLAWLAFHEPD